jgi:hypothetical protein
VGYLKNKRNQKLAVAFLVISLISGLGFNLSVAQENSKDSSTFWSGIANNAWKYFQPGVGVDATTGLPQNGVGSGYFTDWETGLYIQAILDMEQMGLLSSGDIWGADDRINRVLNFLETRPLMADGLPYIAYNASNGEVVDETQQVATDEGHLFVALKNLEDTKPVLKARIDNIVYNLTNYTRREV